MVIEVYLLMATLLVEPIGASLGDHSEVFINCLAKCSQQNACPSNVAHIAWIFERCFSCKYDCIWKTVKYFREVLHEDIPQFYGKWPFIAVRLPLFSIVPMQELASVIFSMMNLHSVLKMYRAVRLLPDRSRMKAVWRIYSLIGLIVWICSTLFHWADFWLTEYADYFSAFAIIVYALFASISLSVPYFQRSAIGRIIWLILFVALFSFYIKHIRNLWVRFDYGYNMQCCILFSLMTALIYSLWMIMEWRSRTSWERRSIPFLALAVFGGLASILLEVFDFAPLFWLVDAHALFHLATVPLPLFLTRFIQLENEYEMDWLTANIKFA
uniref:Post-GPI attachment to proteins factor 3 n=1 Tax=Parascaris univalens TaxID=6257 RepID=A0A915BBP3_PARUN